MSDIIANRIREIALEFCSDYPDVTTTDTLDLLWAIESTLRGWDGAINGWSKICNKLAEKAGITKEQVIVMWDQILKDGSDA